MNNRNNIILIMIIGVLIGAAVGTATASKSDKTKAPVKAKKVAGKMEQAQPSVFFLFVNTVD